MNQINKKKEFKYLVVFCIISLLAFVIVSPLRRGYVPVPFLTGPQECNIVSFVINFILIFYCLSKYGDRIRPYKILLAVIIGASFFQLPLTIFSYHTTAGSRIGYITSLLAILLGYISYKIKPKHRIVFYFVCIFCGIWLSVWGENYWLHKLHFGTFTGTLSEKTAYDFKFQTSRGESTSISDFKKEYILIDCWYTYCGVCYQEFPKVQELYNKYKNSGSVEIFTLHSRIKEESETFSTGEKILKGRGYTIPAFSIDIDDEILKKLGVNAYPTVFIFDKESNLIFRGDIKSAEELIDELANN